MPKQRWVRVRGGRAIINGFIPDFLGITAIRVLTLAALQHVEKRAEDLGSLWEGQANRLTRQ